MRNLLLAVAVPLALLVSPASAQGMRASGSVSLTQLSAALDTIWLLTAAALVFFMQIGFMMLEAGAVRTKNAVSVAQKNLLDIAFATLAFAGIGYMLAFGTSSLFGIFGWDARLLALNALPEEDVAFFVFQVMFCGTAATIISGAVAERMTLRAYVLVATLLAALVYPVFAHWAWGSARGSSSSALLANAGFVDFAGSTVVHATGAWMALACILLLGARAGRFESGQPVRFGGHSAVLSSAGALILVFGWIGFNGGSTLAASAAVPGIILNTVLAAAAGGCVGYGRAWLGGPLAPERAINGMVAGLVAVTAGCHLVDPWAAVLLGAAGGHAANHVNALLERRLRLDDAVGAVGVHGAGGVVGTLGLALLAPVELLPAGSRMDQLAIQAAGVGINFAWAFGAGLVLVLGLGRLIAVRVSAQSETQGLNVAEHDIRLGLGHLEKAMANLEGRERGGKLHIEVEAGDDAQELTEQFNRLMETVQGASNLHRDANETENFAFLGEMTSDAILLVQGGRVRSANPAAATLFGAPTGAIVGRSTTRLGRSNRLYGLTDWLKDPEGAAHECLLRADDGRETPVQVTVHLAAIGGRPVTVVRLTDLTEKRAAEARIFHLALHDPLTDLPNRELFKHRLEEAIAEAGEANVSSLLLIDLDKFKDINDLHGHPAGDAVLVATAERLKACVRRSDTVARLGGDEFAIVQSRLTFANQAADLAHRALSALSEQLTLPSGATIRPRASIGVAVFPRDGEGGPALLQNADLALYAAKNAGRNNYRVFEPGMGAALRLRQELEADLGEAIARGELALHFQPRIDIAQGRIASYEALLRWRHGDRFVSPADFIPIAEASGLILSIGEWVVTEACHIAVRDLTGSPISVNVSPRQFLDPEFVTMIRKALAESGLAPGRLELEITENVFIDDDRLALRTLAQVQALGVRMALDDFGTGFSSLSYLTRFNFDTIKIDRSFVQANDDKAWHVIRSVLSMSRGLKASVVVEGVETVKQLERLAAEGCTEIQGFLFARPAPAIEVMRALPGPLLSMIDRANALRPSSACTAGMRVAERQADVTDVEAESEDRSGLAAA